MLRIKFIPVLLLTLFSASALASGSSSYSAPSSSSSGSNVDSSYERGKAIFKGRLRGAPKIDYCIDTGSEKVKLKSKTAKLYKGYTRVEFANRLYDCDNPDTPVKELLSASDYSQVVYYLNKRYRLKLRKG